MREIKTYFYYIAILLTAILSACDDETKVKSVEINPTQINLAIGEEYQLEMLITPLSAAIHNPTAWSSTDNSVAVVDRQGVVTAVGAGECKIVCKAMHSSGECAVSVAAPEYDLSFRNAIVFNEGDKDGNGSDNLIVRLYEDGLTIDKNGKITGNGIFVNLSMLAAKADGHIPEGEYAVDSLKEISAVIPGRIYESAGQYFATGSFVGQYNNNGLSVMFLTKGHTDVKATGDEIYTIIGDMIGNRGEVVKISYSGKPEYYRTDLEADIIEIEYVSAEVSDCQSPEGSVLNRAKITLASADGYLVDLYARIPRSVTGILPDGVYRISADDRAFTLHSENDTPQCTINHESATTIIVSGTIEVTTDAYNRQTFEASFTDSDDKEYFIKSKSEDNRVSLRINQNPTPMRKLTMNPVR